MSVRTVHNQMRSVRDADTSVGAGPVAVRVFFLSALRDLVNGREIELRLPQGATLRTVAEELVARFGLHVPSAQAMATLNGHGWQQTPQGLDTPLSEGDVIHLFPPIAGG